MAGVGIEFGSHTVNHAVLPEQSAAAIQFELAESKAALEAVVGRPVDMLAYPNGGCSRAVVRRARSVGYRIGCTTRSQRVSKSDDRLLLPRIEPVWDFADGNGAFSETMFQWRAR
jgi:peptidoglycan/xylan/chitin deacetylase (PgdA/CDA1 family)